MTHWDDPTVLIAELFALTKFVHILGGIYIWEFFSNLDFEYSIITGKRRFTWSFPLYLGCRLCPLFAIMVEFLVFDLNEKVNCRALDISASVFGYLSFSFASALFALRVVAIWDFNKIVVTIVALSWLATFSTYIYCITKVMAVWNALFEICQALHIETARFSMFSTLVSDLVLLILMFVGLLRWGHSRQKYGMWWFLYTQGLLWVLLVTLGELPPTIFLILDLNDPLNLMFQTPSLIIMAMGASRLYRALIEAYYHQSIGAPASSEWSTELRSVPKVLSQKVSVAAETPARGLVLAPHGPPTTTFESEVTAVKDADIV